MWHPRVEEPLAVSMLAAERLAYVPPTCAVIVAERTMGRSLWPTVALLMGACGPAAEARCSQ
jgi:hypothetical protein